MAFPRGTGWGRCRAKMQADLLLDVATLPPSTDPLSEGGGEGGVDFVNCKNTKLLYML